MSEQCLSVCRVRDDHWGVLEDPCVLEAGHPGLHVASRDACDPVAWHVWSDTPINFGTHTILAVPSDLVDIIKFHIWQIQRDVPEPGK